MYGLSLPHREALGVGEGLLELGRELVEAHRAPEVESAAQMWPAPGHFNGSLGDFNGCSGCVRRRDGVAQSG